MSLCGIQLQLKLSGHVTTTTLVIVTIFGLSSSIIFNKNELSSVIYSSGSNRTVVHVEVLTR